MKTVLLILCISIAFLSSCIKTKTCVCRDIDGNIISEETSKTTSQKASQDFVNKCRSKENTYTWTGSSGSISATVPCEIR